VPKFQLVLLIHAHQPVGNFEDVLERCYQQSYLPFVDVLARHPNVRIGLHYSGPLLEWMERAHPEYFEKLRGLVAKGQIEIVGGGFYEPILAVIPLKDCHAQITRLADYVEKHFGARPRGAWLAERIWEPQLPSQLAPAGVEYTVVDDNHFLGAGFELEQLYGHYLAEDQRHTVKVLPGLKALRYLIPFRGVPDVIGFLRDAASRHPGGFAAMGDDLEKFGSWPGTYEHCYTNGWVDQLFAALDQSSEWLETRTPGEAAASHAPLGRADLPTASYTEMMEWALPTVARSCFHGLVHEFDSRGDVMPFLRGGSWRGFFTKYSESNLLHKKLLYVSEKVGKLAESKRRDQAFLDGRKEAGTLLLQGQCNDAFWHGVFGGLYSPHLRTALWRSLLEAEAIADRLEHRKAHYETSAKFDFDADGREDIYFTSDRYAALVQPADGGTVSALDCRSSKTAMINSLMRRPEAYHAALREASSKSGKGPQSIHDQKRMKEEGLDRWLHYDRWPRHSFRVLLFGRGKTYQDCVTVSLDPDPAIAGGDYRVTELNSARVKMASKGSPDWPVEKTLSFAPTETGFEIQCDVALRRVAQGAASVYIGIETVVNFLAPSAHDRYFESNGQRFPLRWAAAVPASPLRVVDEWQGVQVAVTAPSARDFWIAPIETVSEAEDGFERIYQGSQIIAVWPVELAPGGQWDGKLTFKVEPRS
jgi:4-alpha-glucanotransferase